MIVAEDVEFTELPATIEHLRTLSAGVFTFLATLGLIFCSLSLLTWWLGGDPLGLGQRHP